MRKTIFFSKITTLDLFYVVTVKSTLEILQNFVAFSEYMNFTNTYSIYHLRTFGMWMNTSHDLCPMCYDMNIHAYATYLRVEVNLLPAEIEFRPPPPKFQLLT